MDITKIKIGDKAPAEFNAVIEIPQGSLVKYEFNREGELKVDRFMGLAEAYPFNYGFIPETLAGDGDALDVMALSSQPVESGSSMMCRPIGILQMEDEGGMDEKILAVPLGQADADYSSINDLVDLDLPTREKIKLFFVQYKETEQKHWSKVANFGDRAEAIKGIIRAQEAFKRG